MFTRNIYLLFNSKSLLQNVKFQVSSKSSFNRGNSSFKKSKNAFTYKKKGELFNKKTRSNSIIDLGEVKNESVKDEFSDCENGKSLQTIVRSENQKDYMRENPKDRSVMNNNSKFPSGLLYDINNFFKNSLAMFDFHMKGPGFSIKDFPVLTKNLSNFAAIYSEKGMVVEIEMKDFKEEDFKIRVEDSWLIIEVSQTVEKEGGLVHQEIYRRYEMPPNSDVSNITTTVRKNRIKIFVPTVKPKITRKRSEDEF